jgi:hypothetical protein
MPTKRNAGSPGNPAFGPKLRTCRSCRGQFPAGSLVRGECPTCAGLAPLPLRGEGGKFITFTTGSPSTGGDR